MYIMHCIRFLADVAMIVLFNVYCASSKIMFIKIVEKLIIKLFNVNQVVCWVFI